MAVHYQVTGATAAEISGSVETGVRRGALVAGQSLPPVRHLADTLRVSPATVAAAYKALRQRGIVETNGRNGTRIRPRPPVVPTRAGRRLPVPPGVLDLSTGEPDARLLPRLPALSHREPVGYQHAGPLPEMVATARERLAGVRAPAVTVTGGALDGIDRVLLAHLRPGDRVGVEDPGWANLLDLVAAQGLSPVPVPVDEHGPTPDGMRAAVAAGVAAVIVTTRAHNPTGATVTESRAALLRKELRPEILVIEDDHCAELAREPLHALAGATDRWAFIRSVSKPYGPDLRLAVLGGDETTVARVAGRMRSGAGWVSTILQRLVLALWSDEGTAAKVRRAADSYDVRRGRLVDALRARGLDATGRSGINIWVPVPDETGAVARLRDAGYAVAPGSLFRIGAPPGLRVTVSRLDLRAVEPLADAVLAAAAPTRFAGAV